MQKNTLEVSVDHLPLSPHRTLSETVLTSFLHASQRTIDKYHQVKRHVLEYIRLKLFNNWGKLSLRFQE